MNQADIEKLAAYLAALDELGTEHGVTVCGVVHLTRSSDGGQQEIAIGYDDEALQHTVSLD